jgi:hypothetical protein
MQVESRRRPPMPISPVWSRSQVERAHGRVHILSWTAWWIEMELDVVRWAAADTRRRMHRHGQNKRSGRPAESRLVWFGHRSRTGWSMRERGGLVTAERARREFGGQREMQKMFDGARWGRKFNQLAGLNVLRCCCKPLPQRSFSAPSTPSYRRYPVSLDECGKSGTLRSCPAVRAQVHAGELRPDPAVLISLRYGIPFGERWTAQFARTDFAWTGKPARGDHDSMGRRPA